MSKDSLTTIRARCASGRRGSTNTWRKPNGWPERSGCASGDSTYGPPGAASTLAGPTSTKSGRLRREAAGGARCIGDRPPQRACERLPIGYQNPPVIAGNPRLSPAPRIRLNSGNTSPCHCLPCRRPWVRVPSAAFGAQETRVPIASSDPRRGIGPSCDQGRMADLLPVRLQRREALDSFAERCDAGFSKTNL
jgi:hypothetical protein